jgi:hypothetical protein
MVTSYKIRPVELKDPTVIRMLNEHVQDLSRATEETSDTESMLTIARRIMAERIFRDQLKYDIICLQEADYLDPTLFPSYYEWAFTGNEHSINGIIWNKKRFEIIDVNDDIMGRAIAIRLFDKESHKLILVASGHITGCNPFYPELNPATQQLDSAKGDNELTTIVQLFDNTKADIKLIAMDSNVTATHPRLKILKENGYEMDGDNHFEQTCTNPNLILNTRLDWIALKSNSNAAHAITNIAVQSIGLNSIQTNISDHKPVAALIKY